MTRGITLLLAAGLLSACGVSRGPAPVRTMQPGAELVGQQVRLETAQGQVSTLRFAGDGSVRAAFGTREVSGNWVATQGRLCFAWAGSTSRECWPYTAPLRRGETVTLTSDRGNVVRVTLQ